jgi:peptide/nickel transport system permease protein
MWRNLLSRLAIFALTILLAITLNFVVVRITRADPIAAILGRMAGKGLSVAGGQQILELYTKTFALDQPIYVQYLLYLKNLADGDLGYSLSYFPQPVSAVLFRAIPWSLGLLAAAVSIAFVFGNLLGAIAAWPKSPAYLRGLIYVFLTFSAIPYYLMALILLYVFAFYLQIFPTGGTFTVGGARDFSLGAIADVVHHAALPVLSLTLGLIGFWALSMRGVMTTVLGEDYLAYARVKGLRERTIFMRYGMRNAMLPQITALAIDIGQLISGQVLVEAIFAYPGVGTVLFNALRTADYFVIQGVVLFIIVSVATTMLIVDLLYPLLDPRVRSARAAR